MADVYCSPRNDPAKVIRVARWQREALWERPGQLRFGALVGQCCFWESAVFTGGCFWLSCGRCGALSHFPRMVALGSVTPESHTACCWRHRSDVHGRRSEEFKMNKLSQKYLNRSVTPLLQKIRQGSKLHDRYRDEKSSQIETLSAVARIVRTADATKAPSVARGELHLYPAGDRE